jgi:hypothetical protein
MVYQEKPGSDQGLVIWAASGLYPQPSISIVPFQVNVGLVYKGLIPRRDDDQTTFGVIYGKFSGNYARTVKAAGDGDPDYESVIEAGHRIPLTKFAFINPTSSGSFVRAARTNPQCARHRRGNGDYVLTSRGINAESCRASSSTSGFADRYHLGVRPLPRIELAFLLTRMGLFSRRSSFFDIMQVHPGLNIVARAPAGALFGSLQVLAGCIAPTALGEKRVPNFDLFFARPPALGKAPFEDLLVRAAL